jgi:hypothetical protein
VPEVDEPLGLRASVAPVEESREVEAGVPTVWVPLDVVVSNVPGTVEQGVHSMLKSQVGVSVTYEM